jgi:hypothetical protein
MQFIPLSLIKMMKKENGINHELGLGRYNYSPAANTTCQDGTCDNLLLLLIYLQSVLFILLLQWI